jgi:hypothetical protein
MVPSKGRSAYVAERVVSFLDEICLNGDAIVKSDQESSIKAIVEQIGRLRSTRGSGKWIVEHSPVGASQSNGIVERAAQSMQGQLRTIKIALEKRWGADIPAEHPIIAWAVEYGSLLLNRFEAGHDWKTSYERLKGKKATTMGIEFGEMVLWKALNKGGALGKLASTWRSGVFLGVRAKSGELIISDKSGVYRTRTVQRKPFDERWDAKSAEEVPVVEGGRGEQGHGGERDPDRREDDGGPDAGGVDEGDAGDRPAERLHQGQGF